MSSLSPQRAPEQELARAKDQGRALEPSSDPAWPPPPAGGHTGDPRNWTKALVPSINLAALFLIP